MRTLWFWSAVAAVTVLRAVASARIPLTGDEAYYWEWSRHLAFGYVDHPPAVAYAIALFAWLGRTPLAVRAAFVLCGVVTALATAGAATRITGDRRAGAAAAAGVTLTPMLFIAFGSATPDGPYLACWALALYFAVRAFESRSLLWFALLGLALGGAMLARVFGFALVFGVAAYAAMPARKWSMRGPLWLSLALAFACIVPFVAWNAANEWSTFTFALVGRHAAHVQFTRPFVLHVINAFAYSPGLYAAAFVLAFRRNDALVAWTALPLSILLTLLAIREPIEVYWFFGPFVSLCVSMGIAYHRLSAPIRRPWTLGAAIPAIALSAVLFAVVLAPGAVYAMARHGGVRLHDDGPFEVFTYPALARDVARIAAREDAIVMTDGYGFSSELDFYGGVAPIVIGYDPQGDESRRWYDARARVQRALFVDKTPLYPVPGHPEKGAGRPDFAKQLALACRRVYAGPTLTYTYAGSSDVAIPPRDYFTTWCDGMRPNGLLILQWRHVIHR
ncbi:MAG: glycosyltransferase family 39 protein [Candidatus Eremiobacteraeota bacterium]|nr:glycosyltransferase family 39 protein [Candidatus Eremiobacteraeota bacterium]